MKTPIEMVNFFPVSGGNWKPVRPERRRGRTWLFAALVITALGGFSLPAAQASGGGGGDSGGGSGEMDRMVPIQPMPITIIHQGQIKGILMIEFYVEAPNFGEAGRINQILPRLIDAYRTGLSEFASHEMRLDRPVDLDRLDLYLTRETHRVLGKKDSHIVFRQVMLQRR